MKPDAVSVFPRPDISMERQAGKLLRHFCSFLSIFVLAAESVGPVPSWCQQCAGVTTGGLLADLLDLSSCRGGNGTWIVSFFFLLKAVLAAMSSVASTVNPHAHQAAPLL